MPSIVDDLADYLEDEGVGTVGTDIFVGKLPDTPDACVAVFTNRGGEPDRYIPTAEMAFQILVRTPADEHDEAEAKCAQIMGILHQLANVTLPGGNYVYFVAARTEPYFLGTDSQGRNEFTMNFTGKAQR